MYDKVKMLSAKTGWTMKEIAEKLEISESYLYKLINGDRHNTKQIKKIIDLVYDTKYVSPFLKNYVKTECRKRHLSFRELANKLNISLSYLYDILNGRRSNNKIKRRLEIFCKGESV